MLAAGLAPQNIELKPAKINDRFIAYVLDTLPFVAGHYGCLYGVMTRMPQLSGDKWLEKKLAAAWIALYCLYHAVGNAAGGTIGKRLMGIVPVRKNGEALGFGRGLLRGFGNVISAPLCNFGYIVALFHPESRALHDLLAGTAVVEKREKGPAESWLSFLAAMTAIVGMVAGIFSLALRAPTRADLRRIAAAKEGLPIVARIEEAYFAAHGAYTDSLADLAQASGDPEAFHSAMEDIFDPHLIEIKAGNKRYRITVAALDRRRTRLTVDGPR